MNNNFTSTKKCKCYSTHTSISHAGDNVTEKTWTLWSVECLYGKMSKKEYSKLQTIKKENV